MTREYFFLIFLLVVSSLFLSINISKPFIGQHDWNGVVYGQQAKNFVRYGYLPLRFGATLSAEKKSIEELRFSTHYPPTFPILISISYRLFGISEWSTRLVPVVASLASVALIFLIGSRLASFQVGVVAAILATLTPMFIYYGKNPVHEIVQLPFTLLGFYSYLQWSKAPARRWQILLISSLTAAMLIGWSGYYAVGLLALHGFLFSDQKHPWVLLLLLAVSLFSLYIWHTQVVAPGSITAIKTSALSRTGLSGFSTVAWVGRETRYAINLFTGMLLALSGIWVLGVLWRVARTRITHDKVFLGFLGLYGATHAVLFRDASWFHEYLLFPLLPFLALSGAMTVNGVLVKLKSVTRRAVFITAVLVAVGWERAGYAQALLQSEYARRDYEDAIQFVRNNERKKVRIPEERDVYFVFYADRLD